jgi:hypothetical protein
MRVPPCWASLRSCHCSPMVSGFSDPCVHGDLATAVAANPAGIVAVVVAIGLLIAWRTKAVRLPAATVPLALLAMWGFELVRFDVF